MAIVESTTCCLIPNLLTISLSPYNIALYFNITWIIIFMF